MLLTENAKAKLKAEQPELLMFLELVRDEFARARQQHRPCKGAVEVYEVVREEFVEFEREVYKRRGNRDPEAMLTELTQIAAMCFSAITEVLDPIEWPQDCGSLPEALARAVQTETQVPTSFHDGLGAIRRRMVKIEVGCPRSAQVLYLQIAAWCARIAVTPNLVADGYKSLVGAYLLPV